MTGALIAAAGVLGIIDSCLLLRPANWLARAALSVLIVICVFIADNGVGMMLPADSRPTVFRSYSGDGKPDVIYVAGYNGSVVSMYKILEPWTGNLRVAGLIYGPGRFDPKLVVAALVRLIQENPDALIYSESAGAVLVAEALRSKQGGRLHLKNWFLNAAPAAPEHVKPPVWVGRFIYGGPAQTQLMRLVQRSSINRATTEASMSPASQTAYWRSFSQLSSPQALGVMEFLANFEPMQLGEFAGRVDDVYLAAAPGTEDAMIRTSAANEAWEEAFGTGVHVHHTDVNIVELSVPPGMHCPLPEYPGAVGNLLYKLLVKN